MNEPTYLEVHMVRALELASEALQAQEVPVGCVFVNSNGEVLAESRNRVNETRNPTRHAELNCIDKVMSKSSEKGDCDHKELFRTIVVYVTVEPCIMCSAALHSLNISHVFYGCANDRFGGKTVLDVGLLYSTKYTLTGGLKGDLAMDLLKQFYKGVNPQAPDHKRKKKVVDIL